MARTARRVGVVAAAAALAITLVACSSNSGSGSPASTTSGSVVDSSAAGPTSAASSAPATGGTVSGASTDVAPSSYSGPASDVSIGISSLNASHMWEFIARDENTFVPYGINLKLVVFQGASEVLPSLLGGSTQFSEPSTPQTVAAMQKQSGLKVVFASLMGNPTSLVAAKGITSIDQLKGKKISVNAAGSSSDYYGAVAFLTAHGIDPKDVTFITGGATSARVTALLSGAVDAVLCSPPDIERLTSAGDNVLGSVDDVPGQKDAIAYVGLAKQSWLDANHDVAVRFMEGYQATQLFMRDPANKDKVIADIVKELNTDAKGAADVYDYFLNDAESNLDPTGSVTTPGIVASLKAAQVTQIPDDTTLTGYYDNSFAQAAAAVTGAKASAPEASSSSAPTS